MPISQVILDQFHVMRSTHREASVPLLRKEGPLIEVLLAEGLAYLPAAQVDRADAFPVPAIVHACIQATEETPHQARLLGPYGVDAAWTAGVKQNAGVLAGLAEERTVRVRHATIDRDLEGGLREETAEALRPVLFTLRAGKMERWSGGGLEDLGTLSGAYATLVNVHAAITHPFVRERCLALSLPQEKLDRIAEMKHKLYGYFTTVASLEAAPETNALQIRVARALLLDELRLLWSQVQWVLPHSEQEKFAMGRLLGRPSSGRARPDAPEPVVPTPVTQPPPPIVVGPPVVTPPVPPALAPVTPAPPVSLVPPVPVLSAAAAPLPPAGTVLGTIALPGHGPLSLIVQPDGTTAWTSTSATPSPTSPEAIKKKRGKAGKAPSARANAAPPAGRSRRR